MSLLLVNIDVPDLDNATRFYTEAFGLRVGRRFDDNFIELVGLPSPIFLLAKKEGSAPFSGANIKRDFSRHWSPIHLDLVVDNLDSAILRALAAGAAQETEIRAEKWGRMATFSDPFGNGFCIIQFLNRGYDEIASHQ